MASRRKEAWQLYNHIVLDGIKEIELTQEQVEGQKPFIGNNGEHLFRAYSLDCPCGFKGRIRKFTDCVLEGSSHGHRDCKIIAGSFRKPLYGEKVI